jgi:hypothetical protein
MSIPAPRQTDRRSALIFALDVTGGDEVVYRVAVYLQDLARKLADAPGLARRARIDLVIFDAQDAAVVSQEQLLAVARRMVAGPNPTGVRFAPLYQQLKQLPYENGGFHTFILLTRTPAAGWEADVAPLHALVASVTALCCGPDPAPDVARALSKEPGGTRIVDPLATIRKQFDSIGAWLMGNFADPPSPLPEPPAQPAAAAPPDGPPPAEERPAAVAPPTGAKWRVIEPTDPSDPAEHFAARQMAGAGGWQLIGASRRGKLHAHEGSYREDAFALGMHHGWHLIAVADGAGSCRLSRVGARVACESAIDGLKSGLNRFWNGATDDLGAAMLRRVICAGIEEAHAAIYTEAGKRKIPVRELSSTLLLLAFGPVPSPQPWLAVGQIGDGLVLAVGPGDELHVLGAAEKGFYAGETVFLPSLAVSEWEAHTWALPAEPLPAMVLVMTDGVADDLVPLRQQAPTLIGGLREVIARPQPDQDLLAILGYEKRDSADDRTLAVVYRREM